MTGDKRNDIRYKTLINVDLKLSKISSEYFPGIVRNVSFNGLNVISEHFISEPKELLELNIQHPVKDKDIFALGEIVWKRQVESRCYVGLRIREMDENSRIEILEYSFDKL